MGCCGGDAPKIPDPADAYVSGVNTNLQLLPTQRRIEAAAALGTQVTETIPGSGTQTFDFTGLGDAEYNATVADKTAAALLQMQRDLGPAYVQQRLDELAAADPQGHAARQQLWRSIQDDLAGGGSEREAANKLQAGILEELNAGGRLPEGVRQRVSSRVQGGQVARGNWMGNAAAVEEGQALADASEAQRAQRQSAALQFLTTGVSPQDAQFREDQQNLSNLGNFLSGETPVAQFGQLSGAQNGVVPWTTSGPLSGVNPNAGAQGVQNAQQGYLGQLAASNGQVNPWIAGLSGAAQGVGVAASLGAWGGGGAPAFGSTYKGRGGQSFTSVPNAQGGGFSAPVQ